MSKGQTFAIILITSGAFGFAVGLGVVHLLVGVEPDRTRAIFPSMLPGETAKVNRSASRDDTLGSTEPFPRSVTKANRSKVIDLQRTAYHLPVSAIPDVIDRFAEAKMWSSLKVLFSRWAKTDPLAALEKLNTLNVPENVSQWRFQEFGSSWHSEFSLGDLRKRIAYNWAKDDPDAALAHFANSSDSEHWALGAVVDALAEKDPVRAYHAAKKHLSLTGDFEYRGSEPGSMTHIGGNKFRLGSIFAKWVEHDPRQAAAEVSKISDPGLRDHVMAEMLKSWVKVDWSAAHAWMESLPEDELSPNVAKVLVEKLAEEDPQSAIIAGASWSASRLEPFGEAAQTVLRNWMKEDLTDVLNWGRNLEEGALRQEVLARAIKHYAETDPAAAAEYALTLPPGERQQAITMAGGQWGWKSPDEARAWAERIDDPVLANHFLLEVHTKQALASPQELAGTFDATVSPQLQPLVAERLIEYWSRTDPAAAAQWLENRGSGGDDTTYSFAHVSSKWSSTDPEAAARWVGKLPDAPNKHAATVGFVEHMLGSLGQKGTLQWIQSNDSLDASLMENMRRLAEGGQQALPVVNPLPKSQVSVTYRLSMSH